MVCKIHLKNLIILLQKLYSLKYKLHTFITKKIYAYLGGVRESTQCTVIDPVYGGCLQSHANVVPTLGGQVYGY